MKKFLFFVMTLAVVMTACKKEENQNVSLDGNQWITEEFEASGDFPAGRFLFDFGAKSGAGKMSSVIVVTESNAEFAEGDLVLLFRSDYTYDASAGKLSTNGVEALVEYLTPKKIQISEGDESRMVFSLVEGKQYPVNDAVAFEPETFEITPSKEADWAGGSITFTSDRTIELTYEVLTEGLTEQDICKTSLSGNTLTLGQYVGADAALANCQIRVKATDEEDNETECIVTSKAWKPAVYTEYKGVYTLDDLQNGWSRGQDCWLGALCANGEIPYDRGTDSFSGISYKVPDFMKVLGFGSKDNKAGYDTPLMSVTGTITYTYGALSYALIIDIDR